MTYKSFVPDDCAFCGNRKAAFCAKDDFGRHAPIGAVVSHGFVFPPGTDILKDVLSRVEDPNGRPVMPIGVAFKGN